MANRFSIDISEAEAKIAAFGASGEKLESIVNDVLHDDAGQRIMANIMPYVPRSGRMWKGKRNPAARDTQPFREEHENLSVIVRTKTPYHYLYFPDDGSNTVKHAGNQQFMYRGAQETAPDIIELCKARIIKEIGG